jgi:hypothetical protein
MNPAANPNTSSHPRSNSPNPSSYQNHNSKPNPNANPSYTTTTLITTATTPVEAPGTARITPGTVRFHEEDDTDGVQSIPSKNGVKDGVKDKSYGMKGEVGEDPNDKDDKSGETGDKKSMRVKAESMFFRNIPLFTKKDTIPPTTTPTAITPTLNPNVTPDTLLGPGLESGTGPVSGIGVSLLGESPGSLLGSHLGSLLGQG